MAKPLSCFIVTIQNESGVDYKIVDDKSFTIGRSLEATLALSDANISRIHVVVSMKHDRVWIEDQGSANGTLVNGEKIAPHKMVALAAVDKVRLGLSTVEFGINTIEKCFKREELKDSELPKQDKESLLALVHGAHAEAQRLVKLGQDHNEKLIKSAETKAAQIEQSAEQNKDELIRSARDQGEQIIQECKKKGAHLIFEAEQNARKAVENIHTMAETTRREAETYFQAQTAAAQVKADEIIAKHTEMGKDLIQEALLQSQIKAEQLEKDYLERARIRGEEEAHALLEKAKTEASNERQQLLLEAQKEIDHWITQKTEIEVAVTELVERKKIAEVEYKDYADRVAGEKEKLLQERRQSILKETEEILEELEKQNRKYEENRAAFARETAEQIEKQTREVNMAVKNQRNELAQLTKETNELSHRLEQKRKIFDEEMQLQRELKEKEALRFYDEKKQEIELLSQQRQKEIEVAKREKEEEAEIFVKSKKLEYEKLRNSTEETIKKLETEKSTLEKDVQRRRDELLDITERHQESENRVKVLEPQFLRMKSEMQAYENQTDSLKSLLKEQENKKGHLSLQIQEIQEKMNHLRKDYESQTAEYKSKLDQEYNRLRREQEDQLERLHHDEMLRAKKVREELAENLFREKDKISKDIFHSLEIEIVKVIKPADWSTISQSIKEKIHQTLEDRTITVSTDSNSEGAETISIPKKKRAERMSYWMQGIMAGMLALYLGQYSYQKFQEDGNPMKTAAEEDAKKRAEDLERRKFNPPQTDELRESYVDSVIYTENFVQNYLNEEFQNKWLKSSSSYLLRQWRIEENKTIEILSAVNSLIKTLEEKKQNIHPDFIDDGIAKMNELEAVSSERLKEMLGSEVKYQAFRRYEKRFYLKEYQGRAPATSEADKVEPTEDK